MFTKRASTLTCASLQVVHGQLLLDETTLDAARLGLGDCGVPPRNSPSRRDIIELLNMALATELVCVLRYKRHHFTAGGLSSPEIAAEFMARAQGDADHADRLARRIAQLGGEPDFSPDSLSRRSHADYDDSLDLKSMIRADFVAERVTIENYRQMITLIGDRDPATRRLLEDIRSDEQAHAEVLKAWLAG